MRETDPNDLFNEYIIELEKKNALELIEKYHDAQKRAESCGCKNCRLAAEQAELDIIEETRRIEEIPWMDHEENWFADNFPDKWIAEQGDE